VNLPRIAILVCFAALLGVPFLFRPTQARPAGNAEQVIIITPHNEQIRFEFAQAFDEWHRKRFGKPVNVVFNVPGGTSEIRRMLEAQYRAALEAGANPGGNADLVFGGGSYEFDQYKKPIVVEVARETRQTTITVPVDFDQAWLDEIYGPNVIGGGKLYDPELYWFGVALSGFGIVFNRDVLKDLGLPEPNDWSDLCDPRARNAVALVNPGQSGSIKTTFEAILHRRGWEEGWRILHRAGANARYFSGSSLKPPIDVTQGNAAMGMCIDFFGRYQAQAMKEAGDSDRVGYVDPIGGSTIDADPIAMLRGAPNPEVARRFIAFCLSSEGQALWQYRRRDGSSTMGPRQFELRRLPIARNMYEVHLDQFIDKVNPFELAQPLEKPDTNFRDLIAPIFAAMVMDNHRAAKEAWRAIVSDPAYPAGAGGMVKASDVRDLRLRLMIERFDALPSIAAPNGTSISLHDGSRLGEVRAGWMRGKWADQRLWNPETGPADEMRHRFGRFFRDNYREIMRLAESAR
jgi:iron(III) transport system substrate-binding protein